VTPEDVQEFCDIFTEMSDDDQEVLLIVARALVRSRIIPFDMLKACRAARQLVDRAERKERQYRHGAAWRKKYGCSS
jgi:hypothetical protein